MKITEHLFLFPREKKLTRFFWDLIHSSKNVHHIIRDVTSIMISVYKI